MWDIMFYNPETNRCETFLLTTDGMGRRFSEEKAREWAEKIKPKGHSIVYVLPHRKRR